MKIRLIFASLLTIFCAVLYGQNLPIELPDLEKVDSIRVVKKRVPGDTSQTRKVQMITFFYNNSPGDTASHDTKKLRFQDSTAVAGALAQKIYEASNQAANGTYLMYNTLKKTKGIDQFMRAFRRVTGITYHDATWTALKNAYIGNWTYYGSGVTTHQFAVNDAADAERTTGTPKYKGKVRVWSDNRVELFGYLQAGKSIIFDFVERLQNGQNVFMSQDGSQFIYK